MIRSIAKKIQHMIRMIRIQQCHHCCLFCKYWNICKEEEEAIRVLQEYINLKKIDAGKREDTMSEQNLMIRKNGKVKCIIFKE